MPTSVQVDVLSYCGPGSLPPQVCGQLQSNSPSPHEADLSSGSILAQKGQRNLSYLTLIYCHYFGDHKLYNTSLIVTETGFTGLCQMERDSKVRNYLHPNVNGLLLGASETKKFNTLKEKSTEKQGIESKASMSIASLAKGQTLNRKV